MIIPNRWENKKCSKPPTSFWFHGFGMKLTRLIKQTWHWEIPIYRALNLHFGGDFPAMFDCQKIHQIIQFQARPFGGFLNWGIPKSSNLIRIFHEINHPAIKGHPHFRKRPFQKTPSQPVPWRAPRDCTNCSVPRQLLAWICRGLTFWSLQ